ncbi:MAG: methylated-DNA--[protein]-cysteine S-methyltransferase [Lachnospiraceae bacterium]|jgi:methylated-DNA-[protein]-cysteine S-methyltransferase
MKYTTDYESPLGNILIASDGEGLCGLWFENQRFYGEGLGKHEHIDLSLVYPDYVEMLTGVFASFRETMTWLNMYFRGEEPDFTPKLSVSGTEFQKEVWDILLTIPYGKTMTYGQIAELIAEKHGIKKMSAQAVGNAVGHNSISIIIPCHRVIGAGGNLTGYGGGINRKISLLEIEGCRTEDFFIPCPKKKNDDHNG